MEKDCILSIDQSTTSTKAILFDHKGNRFQRTDVPHKQFYPLPGYVEHDPVEIFANCLTAIKKVLNQAQVSIENISALAVTNQRETTVLWDAETGKPIHNALVWQDNRSAGICNEIKNKGLEDLIKKTTGLVISPFFCAPKAAWLVNHVENIQSLLASQRLMFGTIDSWLIWNLTGGKVYITDFSNASRTMLFNIDKLEWDADMLSIFGLEKIRLPEVIFSDEIVGYTDATLGFSKSIPICGVMGDSHAALFGQQCFEPGMIKATYGTGSSIMMNTGKHIIQIGKGLVNSIGWGLRNEIFYVIEGNINFSGDTIKWMAEDLQLIPDSASSAEIAESVPNNGGVYFVPAFAGLGAPYWDSQAKASIYGISRDTKRAHIVRAALESIAFQIKDIVDVMKEESGIDIREIRVDGGATSNNLLMQFQADILETQVIRSSIEELSAQGSAMMALLALGIYDSPKDLLLLRLSKKSFNPKMSREEQKNLCLGWQQAIKHTLTQ